MILEPAYFSHEDPAKTNDADFPAEAGTFTTVPHTIYAETIADLERLLKNP